MLARLEHTYLILRASSTQGFTFFYVPILAHERQRFLIGNS